ncbi:Na(+)/H(+) antiporter NhaA [Actinoplanes italicus]|uniref:Na(+)/H(+) antiporter NhaA n=1 Tax=Actinoplanes italicus TaxID=113567 RepID=A0A2T0JPV4_9ACTN|nr:Na+/H+ antiporter NhaA [Actinoplanes italicus]PRX09451.1 sodium/proton antiporter (NhaA family) [Actinoplanes italicus]GIE36358.1 Na(+)/H(+) antiporter NhaA [Actinoplanes italicus]
MTLFSLGSWPEARRIADVLRTETVGGVLLLGATIVALIWANSPWGNFYQDLSALRVGPAQWHLNLSLAAWAADGLLAIFFFVAGLELKREFVAGDLRDPRRAALPVAAAVGGMIAPALIFVAAGGEPRGWAVPTATDIAFALAVLAVISTHLPTALRTFLLTLAVVDDLLAIAVIAVFYTSGLHPLPLLCAAVGVAVFGLLVQRGRTAWWLLMPLAVTVWALTHASGIHATVAGVALAFTVPVNGPGGITLAGRFEHAWRPVSAGFAVPVFAFFASGVAVGGSAGTVTVAVVLALVLGKPLGITAATWLVQRFTRARLADGLSWWDVLGLGLLGGIGFTVSLLISELAFGSGSTLDDQAKLGVLTGSLLAALLATVVLRIRNRHYRRLRATEEADDDADGIPDIYQK